MDDERKPQPELQRCPICGVAMVVSAERDQEGASTSYRCVNCGTVITRRIADPPLSEKSEC